MANLHELGYVIIRICSAILNAAYTSSSSRLLTLPLRLSVLLSNNENQNRPWMHKPSWTLQSTRTWTCRGPFIPHLTIQSRIYSRSRSERIDTPSAAFIRIVHNVRVVRRPPDKTTVSTSSSGQGSEVQCFWHRGITGGSKPDYYFLFSWNSSWSVADLPDPREKLGNDPLLCVIASSACRTNGWSV